MTHSPNAYTPLTALNPTPTPVAPKTLAPSGSNREQITKSQGGRLEGKRSGYQNFCSKLFLETKQNLARDQSVEIEKIETRDVWRELGRVWSEMTEREREDWRVFAKGKGPMPVMDRFVQRPTRGVSRESSVIEESPPAWACRQRCCCPPVLDPLQIHILGPPNLQQEQPSVFNVEDYLAKFRIKELLEKSLNDAVDLQSPDPRIFIADRLLLDVAKQIAWERVERMRADQDRAEMDQ